MHVTFELPTPAVAGVDHAVHSGVAAARNMAADHWRTHGGSGGGGGSGSAPYDHIPCFTAASAPLGLELRTVGRCDGDAETHSFWWPHAAPAEPAPPAAVGALRASQRLLDGSTKPFATTAQRGRAQRAWGSGVM